MTPRAQIAEGRVATIHPWDEGRVLKLAREWVPDDWIEHEFTVATAVYESGVPSPRPFEMVRVLGRRGIVYQYVDGVGLDRTIARRPWRFGAVGRRLAEIHSGMHATQAAKTIPDVIYRLSRKIGEVEDLSPRIRDAALERLEDLPSGSSVLHGDFHPGNVLMTAKGPAVIDWPDAARGHPLADVARTLVLARLGEIPAGMWLRTVTGTVRIGVASSYLRSYFRMTGLSRGELSAWLLPVLVARLSEGIDSEREATMRWVERLVSP